MPFFAVLQVTPEEIMSTPADPLTPYASHVVQHMNEDHADSLTAMVKHFTGLTVNQAHLVTLDRLGMDCICIKDKGRMKCRLPFTRLAPQKHRSCLECCSCDEWYQQVQVSCIMQECVSCSVAGHD